MDNNCNKKIHENGMVVPDNLSFCHIYIQCRRKLQALWIWSALTHKGNVSGLTGLSPEGNTPSLGTNKEIYKR